MISDVGERPDLTPGGRNCSRRCAGKKETVAKSRLVNGSKGEMAQRLGLSLRLSTIVNARLFSSRGGDAYHPIAHQLHSPSQLTATLMPLSLTVDNARRDVKRGCQFAEARFANLSHGENRERH